MATANKEFEWTKYFEIYGVSITTGEVLCYCHVHEMFAPYGEFDSEETAFATYEEAQHAMNGLHCSDITDFTIQEFSLTD